MGLDPACQQKGPRELLVFLGSAATLLPGDSGDLLVSASFSPYISMIETSFKVFLASEFNPSASMSVEYEVLSFGTIFGPSESGPCDPVTLQVAVPSSRQLYFVWDCPSCPSSSQLSNKLIVETGMSVVITPEDVSDIGEYETVTIRVTASKDMPPSIELLYSIQKVPLPIPVLRANGPPYVSTASQISVNAEGRPSSCDSLINIEMLRSIQYHWIGNNLSEQNSSSTLHVAKLSSQKQTSSLQFQVEAESTVDPRAIATSRVDVVLIQTMLRLLIKILGNYTLVSVLYEDGDGSTRNTSTIVGASFKWSCQDQNLDCVSHTGTKLNLIDDHGVLKLNPIDFQQGEDDACLLALFMFTAAWIFMHNYSFGLTL